MVGTTRAIPTQFDDEGMWCTRTHISFVSAWMPPAPIACPGRVIVSPSDAGFARTKVRCLHTSISLDPAEPRPAHLTRPCRVFCDSLKAPYLGLGA